MRTIPGIEEQLPAGEEAIRHRLIPAITGGHIINDEERALLTLPPRLSGLGIRNITQEASIEFENSKVLTTDLRNKILDQKENLQQKNKTPNQK